MGLNRRGFTLTELVIVSAFMAGLTLVAIPLFRNLFSAATTTLHRVTSQQESRTVTRRLTRFLGNTYALSSAYVSNKDGEPPYSWLHFVKEVGASFQQWDVYQQQGKLYASDGTNPPQVLTDRLRSITFVPVKLGNSMFGRNQPIRVILFLAEPGPKGQLVLTRLDVTI